MASEEHMDLIPSTGERPRPLSQFFPRIYALLSAILPGLFPPSAGGSGGRSRSFLHTKFVYDNGGRLVDVIEREIIR